MKHEFFSILFICLLAVFSLIFYSIPIPVQENGEIILTIASFLFAIFAGFFISKEGNRYTTIRDQLAVFDGIVSGIYRNIGHIHSETQQKIKSTVYKYYEPIVDTNKWDSVFKQDATLITELHTHIDTIPKQETFSLVQAEALDNTVDSLRDLQIIRKQLITVRDESIPPSQWLLLYILMIILLVALAFTIPSYLLILASLLKGAFATSLIFVAVLLHRLRGLRFFEEVVGESSARDVLAIITAGKQHVT